MKKLLSILILCLLTGSFVQAQKRAQKKERIRALRVAFITEKLELTPEESEKFWPVYNEYDKERRKLRKEHLSNQQATGLTDEETEAKMIAQLETQEKMIALKRTYFQKFKTILPVKKLARLDKAERKFKEVIVKEAQRRKNNKQQQRKRRRNQ